MPITLEISHGRVELSQPPVIGEPVVGGQGVSGSSSLVTPAEDTVKRLEKQLDGNEHLLFYYTKVRLQQ
jgi:hypothetical protein